MKVSELLYKLNGFDLDDEIVLITKKLKVRDVGEVKNTTIHKNVTNRGVAIYLKDRE